MTSKLKNKKLFINNYFCSLLFLQDIEIVDVLFIFIALYIRLSVIILMNIQ
jgi:hypothetical protein